MKRKSTLCVGAGTIPFSIRCPMNRIIPTQGDASKTRCHECWQRHRELLNKKKE